MIEGPPGAGKSDLALRLIDRGAVLVSDDRTRLVREGERVIALSPGRMAGCIEVRGLGVVSTPYETATAVGLLVRLGAEEERLPARRLRDLMGVQVRELTLDPFRASAPVKVEWALRRSELPPA